MYLRSDQYFLRRRRQTFPDIDLAARRRVPTSGSENVAATWPTTTSASATPWGEPGNKNDLLLRKLKAELEHRFRKTKGESWQMGWPRALVTLDFSLTGTAGQAGPAIKPG